MILSSFPALFYSTASNSISDFLSIFHAEVILL